MQQRQFLLEQSEIPRQWHNIATDLPTQPPLHPATKEPAGSDDLTPIFCNLIIEQAMTLKRWADIPDEIVNGMALWRPSPLYRALRFEQELILPQRFSINTKSPAYVSTLDKNRQNHRPVAATAS